MNRTFDKTAAAAPGRRFTLNADAEARQTIEVLRYVFLGLMIVGYVFYPMDLWVLGHWLDSWQSHIPFVVTVPSVLFTILMIVNYRARWIRYTFIALMVLNVATGITGSIFHLVWNFEGEIDFSLKGLRDAFEGARPILAALAFTHLGVTGLLCSIVPPAARKERNAA